jgi:hypothetical protein
MGLLRMKKRAERKRPHFFTETVKMLWKNRLLPTCKFGFLLRIGRFAQNFVKGQAAVAEILYIIDNKIIVVPR